MWPGVAVTSSHQLRLGGECHCLHLSVPHLEVEALALGFLGGQEALWEEDVAVGVGIGDQGAAVIGLGPPSQGGRLCVYWRSQFPSLKPQSLGPQIPVLTLTQSPCLYPSLEINPDSPFYLSFL